mgnify:CR=1 FL=1
MPKLQYKPIAVQDECFGGRIGTDSTEMTVLIKLMAVRCSYTYVIKIALVLSFY